MVVVENKDDAVYKFVTAEWGRWPKLRNEVNSFGFRDWIKDEYGITYSYDQSMFNYTVVDEKKYLWMLLKC